MAWAPHVYVQKGRVPFQLSMVRTDRYTAPNEGDLTLRRMSRGVSAEKPELHSSSKENIAHK